MKRIGIIFAIAAIVATLLVSCGKKMKPPTEVPYQGIIGDTLYLMVNPPWDFAHGFNFEQVTSVYFGHDTYLYVADSGNGSGDGRILQMDVAGTIHGEFRPDGYFSPISISQDELMRLLVVTGEKKVYRIDLGPSGDPLVKTVFDYNVNPIRRDSLVIPSDRFMSITDLPDYDRSYYVAVSSSSVSNGRILWFWGSRDNSDYGDSLFSHKFAYRNRAYYEDSLHVPWAFDPQFGTTIGVADGDTFMNPVVTTGNGIVNTVEPNFIYAYESSSALHLLVCQDEGSFPVHDMRYEVETHLYNVYWTFGVSQYPGESEMLRSGLFDVPRSAAMDPYGNVYVVDSGSNRSCGAFKFSKTGALLKTFCDPDSIDTFHNPRSITYDIYGDRRTVFIADTDGNGRTRILRYKLSTDLEH